jgi:hypothetical protein
VFADDEASRRESLLEVGTIIEARRGSASLAAASHETVTIDHADDGELRGLPPHVGQVGPAGLAVERAHRRDTGDGAQQLFRAADDALHFEGGKLSEAQGERMDLGLAAAAQGDLVVAEDRQRRSECHGCQDEDAQPQ